MAGFVGNMMRDPEMRKAMEQQQRLGFNLAYGNLFKDLQLTADQEQKLKDLLVEQGMDVNATSKQGYTPLDVAMGKTVVAQLPVPQESTVALLKKLGGNEGPGPRSTRAPAAQQ